MMEEFKIVRRKPKKKSQKLNDNEPKFFIIRPVMR